MAFEFLGKALRGASDILGGLVDKVGNGRTNDEDDVKRAFGALGRYEEPEDGANGVIDRPLDTAPLLLRLVQDRAAEFGQTEQAERALAVVVENAQIVALVQIPDHHIEMAAVALARELERELVRDELVDPLGTELVDQARLGDRSV
jgi:hypothetical protein